MRKWIVWAALAAGVVVVALGAWWWVDLRWSPKTITRDRAEIARRLEEAGWVSPGLTGPQLTMVGFRTCPECQRYKAAEFPGLHKAQVDTRVILFAPETAGAAERATVAQLWLERRTGWALLERWYAAPPAAWTAPGVPPADGDAARTAVVAGTRAWVEELWPLLRRNGVNEAYPLLIWTDREGQLRAFAGGREAGYRRVREELDG